MFKLFLIYSEKRLKRDDCPYIANLLNKITGVKEEPEIRSAFLLIPKIKLFYFRYFIITIKQLTLEIEERTIKL